MDKSKNIGSRDGKTAIVLFSKNAENEGRRKTLFSSKNAVSKSSKVYQKLIDNIINEANKTSFTVLSYFENAQVGFSFGERLSNVIEDVFSKQYDKVIVIGNDCPELNAERITSIARQLNNKQLVLGPTTDGGVYAIGIKKEIYSKKWFKNLKWESEDLQESISTYVVQSKINLSWASLLFDIDNYNDLKLFLVNSKGFNSLKFILLGVLQLLAWNNLKNQSDRLYAFYSSLILTRGPPLLLSNHTL